MLFRSGSVYQYYTLQAPRERPTGYALAPDETFEFTARFNRLDCGVWLPGDRAALALLGIRYVAWHGGLYEQSRTPGASFALAGLRTAGYRAVAGGGVVRLFAGGGAGSPPPLRGPAPGEPVLCDGWEDGELALDEGALWLYGSGSAELELEAAAPTLVTAFVDARLLAPRILDGRETVQLDLAGEGWHAIVVRGAPGLRFVDAGGP